MSEVRILINRQKRDIKNQLFKRTLVALDRLDVLFAKPDFSSRLCDLAEEFGGWDDLIAHLNDAEEIDKRIIDELRVGTTCLFRAPISRFKLIGDAINNSQVPLRIWSAGCSKGDEAYSVAILADHYNKRNMEIVATDISQSCLDTAKEGKCTLDESPFQHNSFFGDLAGLVIDKNAVLDERVRELVRFRKLNFADLINGSSYFDEAPFDFVFLANVLTHLDRKGGVVLYETIVSNYLKSGGYLFFGSSDSFDMRSERLHFVDYLTFQKVSDS